MEVDFDWIENCNKAFGKLKLYMSTASVISTNLYIEYSLHRRHPYGLSRQYFYKEKKRKTTINHYPRQISDDLRPNKNFSAKFKLVNTADYTYV